MIRFIALSLPALTLEFPSTAKLKLSLSVFAGNLQKDLRQRLPVHITASNRHRINSVLPNNKLS